MKSFTEMMALGTFEERFLYLQEGIAHGVGESTFGSLRYTNQRFYRSKLWKLTRAGIIIRDNGCDLAIQDRPIMNASDIRIHHINPLTPEMFDVDDPLAFDPENLITTDFMTHQLMSYGSEAPVREVWVERTPYDHAPWRKDR